VVVFIVVAAVVTILFEANVDDQAGAYATGVLALMTSAAVAVTLTELRRGHRGAGVFFAAVSAIFVYTIGVTIIDRPEGLVIALIFIVMIVVVSLFSRISRSTELRVQEVVYDEAAERVLKDATTGSQPLRFIANRLNEGDDAEYDEKDLEVRSDNHLGPGNEAVFLEVEITDASDFASTVRVGAVGVGGHTIVRASGPSVPNVLAAVLLDVRNRMPQPPHIYFEWSERAPAENALRFLVGGEGDIPPLTHEILRKAEPDESRRPQVHVGG
jgi:hypothetical protein